MYTPHDLSLHIFSWQDAATDSLHALLTEY